jgi:hypothetical protein
MLLRTEYFAVLPGSLLFSMIVFLVLPSRLMPAGHRPSPPLMPGDYLSRLLSSTWQLLPLHLKVSAG